MKSLAIALNTFRETRRDRAQWVVLLYAMVVLGGAYILSPLAMGEGHRVTRDLGLAGISLVGVFLIVLVGAGLVQKEIERRTILTVLSKPIRRYEFLVGKFLGMMSMVSLVFLGMTILLVATLLVYEKHLEPAVLWAALFTFGELTVMTAVVVALSSFVSPALSGVFTLALFVMGHFSGDLLRFAETVEGVGAWVARGIYLLLPHLHVFNLRPEAAYGVVPEPSRVLGALLYSVFYSAALLAVGSVIFARREFR